MSILHMPILTTLSKPQFLSFSKSVTPLNPNQLFLQFPLHKSPNQNQPRKNLIIRMGGGPRTFPGGVNKWQWKRMQAKKATQLLKARLCRERQIYEMRKRAEMKAAVMELEKPWEVVERAPTLLSVKADEQLKVLADRFQRPGGFDMWSDNDGPQLFDFAGDDDLPSARFFPKGVVHSIKPYQPLLDDNVNDNDNDNDEVALKMAQRKVDMKNRKNSTRRVRGSDAGDDGKRLTPFNEGDLGLEASRPKNYMRSLSMDTEGSRAKSSSGKFRNNGNTRSDSVDLERRGDGDLERRGGGDLERRRDSSLTSSKRGNGDSERRTDSALTSFRRGGNYDLERRSNTTQTSSRRGNGDSERRRDNTTLTGSRRGNGDLERRRDNNTLTSSRWGNGDSNQIIDTALTCSRQGNGDSEGSRDTNTPTLRRGNGDSVRRRENNTPKSSRRGNGDSERGRDDNTLTSSRRGNGDSERIRDNTTRSSRQGQFERDGGSLNRRI